MGEIRNEFQILFEKPEINWKALAHEGRHCDLKERGWEGVD
jgi:hypothetical protein